MGSSISSSQVGRSEISIAHTSAIDFPASGDDRAAALSRVPWHSGQTVKTTARSTNSRMCFCMPSRSLERNERLIRGMRPS